MNIGAIAHILVLGGSKEKKEKKKKNEKSIINRDFASLVTVNIRTKQEIISELK